MGMHEHPLLILSLKTGSFKNVMFKRTETQRTGIDVYK